MPDKPKVKVIKHGGLKRFSSRESGHDMYAVVKASRKRMNFTRTYAEKKDAAKEAERLAKQCGGMFFIVHVVEVVSMPRALVSSESPKAEASRCEKCGFLTNHQQALCNECSAGELVSDKAPKREVADAGV